MMFHLFLLFTSGFGFFQGAINSTSSAVEATSSDVGMKDGNLVFVAGATGRVGSRTVRSDFTDAFVQSEVKQIESSLLIWTAIFPAGSF